jgi:hypothetical protein
MYEIRETVKSDLIYREIHHYRNSVHNYLPTSTTSKAQTKTCKP